MWTMKPSTAGSKLLKYRMISVCLRILAMHGPKMSTFWRFCSIILLILELSKIWTPFCDKGSIDEKSWVKVEKWPLVLGLKLKMWKKKQTSRFSISAPPTEDTFSMWLLFLHLWTVCQKNNVQVFERFVFTKLWDKTSRRCSYFAVFGSYMASILKRGLIKTGFFMFFRCSPGQYVKRIQSSIMCKASEYGNKIIWFYLRKTEIPTQIKSSGYLILMQSKKLLNWRIIYV